VFIEITGEMVYSYKKKTKSQKSQRQSVDGIETKSIQRRQMADMESSQTDRAE
jgi:hypothetical protein